MDPCKVSNIFWKFIISKFLTSPPWKHLACPVPLLRVCCKEVLIILTLIILALELYKLFLLLRTDRRIEAVHIADYFNIPMKFFPFTVDDIRLIWQTLMTEWTLHLLIHTLLVSDFSCYLKI